MKILWFTNIPMPDVNKYYKKEVMGSGGWMGALLALLKKQKKIKIGVVVVCPSYPDSHFTIDNVDYFTIKQSSSRFRPTIFSNDNKPEYLNKCINVIKKYNPDILHIHGTERFYGKLVSIKELNIPIIISIQGILQSYGEWYRWFGNLSLTDILKMTFPSTLMLSGLLCDLYETKQRKKRELEYFKKCNYFFGRTDYDYAYSSFFNSNKKYFHIDRVIRPPFWKMQWQLEKCRKYRIIFTNVRHPRKGTEILIEAVKNLKHHYPDIELILVGSLGNKEYSRYLRNKIKKLGTTVKTIGQLNATEMAQELSRAHVFVSASYIENSPNSLAEAQIIGMPVISSYTGGVSSMLTDKISGLLFPTDNIPMLVNRIISIFEDDQLANYLGTNAQNVARKRHDPEVIIKNQMAAYNTILEDNNIRGE